jgi:hypothetical protein
MPSYRRNAIAVGVLFIACSAASILSIVPLGSMLDTPLDLARLAANDNRVIFTALIEFVWAVTAAGIAIGLYPVLRKYNRALALGAVAARVVEGVLILVGTLGLLVLLTMSKDYTAAGSPDPSSWLASGDLLLAARQWVFELLMSLSFVLGALLYYYVLYRSRLVPRWLSGWGLVGAGLGLVATVYAGFTQEFGFSTVNNVLSIPILVQEMVLAVWLIVKGFNTSAVTAPALTSDLAANVEVSIA